ncbi:autotransporter outer membrane beta-barrel domain-containing protein [Pseudomonas sp. NPDC090755]|uniref:autotransporter outer membrane beta-barrel domain-containing protein n=1 Tax=Pseudomonas sp. NPDC090755 TaxID=3364481 RepID=UPI003839FD5D
MLIEKGGYFESVSELDRLNDTTVNGGSLMVAYGAHLTGTTRLIDGALTSTGAAGVITDGDLVYDYSGAIGQDGMYSTGLSMLGAGSVIKQGAGGLHIEHSTKNQGSELAGGLQLKGGTLWLEDGWHGGAVDKAVLSLSGADSLHAIVDKAVLEGGSGLVLADAATNAQLTIKDTALQAASGTLLLEAKNGSQLTTNVERSTLTGDIAFRDSSSGWLNLLDNSRLTGTIDPVNVKVDGSSRWDVTGNSEVGALINDGMVDFRAGTAGFSTLKVGGDLSGNGTFAMRTALATPGGDLLQVSGQTLGSHTLVVEDSGQEPASATQLRLVDGNGGSGSFGLYGDHVDAGALRYTLQRQGDDWYLATPVTEPVTPPTEPLTPPTEPVNPPTEPVTPPTEPVTPPTEPVTPPTGSVTPPTEPVTPPAEPVTPPTNLVTPPTDPVTPPTDPVTPPMQPVAPPAKPFNPSPDNLSSGANAAVAIHGATAGMWSAQMSAAVNRLGELRMGKDEGGIWTRGIGKRFELDEGSSRAFSQDVQGVEIGADKAIALSQGKLYLGGLLGTAKSDLDFGEGASGKIESKMVGGYATYIDDNGFYVDSVVKYSRFDNEVKTPTNLGSSVKGSYDTDGVGVDVEVGKRIQLKKGWFVEPQLGISATRIEGGGYTASNGLQVESDAVDSLQSRAGALLGRELELSGGMRAQPYVKASYITEHAGDSEVRVNGHSIASELPGNRTEVGAGGVLQVSERSKISLDVGYATGSDIEQPYAVTVGYRYAW